MIRPALFSAILLLAGCARSEEARYGQVDNSPLPEINGTADDDEGIAVGSWQMGLVDDQPVLEFGPVGASELFSIGCDERRYLLLQWPGAAPTGDLPNMLVSIGSETRRFGLAVIGGTTPLLRAVLPSNDPFRNVLINARSQIVVRVGDAPPLVMPNSPAIATYARQCADGTARASATSAGNSSVEANAVEPTGTVNVVAGNAATPSAR